MLHVALNILVLLHYFSNQHRETAINPLNQLQLLDFFCLFLITPQATTTVKFYPNQNLNLTHPALNKVSSVVLIHCSFICLFVVITTVIVF